MVRNVVFDMGKVLLDFNVERYLLRVEREQDRPLVRQALFASVEWVMTDYGTMDDEGLLAAACRRLPQHLHPAAEEIVRTWYRDMPAYPGVGEVIRRLKDEGYRLYILSNYSGDLFERTKEKMPFLPYMDGTLFSYTCHLTKPEPEIYQHLIQKFSLTPDRCVFLDDTKANVEAAEQAGIHGIHFMGYEDGVAQLKKLGVL